MPAQLVGDLGLAELMEDRIRKRAPAPRRAAVVEREHDVAVLRHVLLEMIAPGAIDVLAAAGRRSTS